MTTAILPIEEIKPYYRNAKKHPEEQIKKIARSISAFGFNQPVVIDQKNVVIVGHGRLEAARMLGMKEIPVVKVKLTNAQAKAYRLADNKLNESSWDMELVIDEIKELQSEDYDIELTGFDMAIIQGAEINPNVDDEGEAANQFQIVVTLDEEGKAKNLYDDLAERGFNVKLNKKQ